MNEETKLRTSSEWNKDDNVEILDPDGWDRDDWVHSWYVEESSIVEYRNRVMRSTCLWRDELS